MTKKTSYKNLNLARRDFIKGLTSAGLLSSLSATKLFAQTNAPLRVLFVPLHHGWGSGRDSLEQITGSEFDFQLPGYWAPFEAIKEECVFVDGLRGTFWGNAHDVSYSDILTAAVPIDANNSNTGLGGPFPLPIGPSIDHHLATVSGRDALRFCARYSSWGAPFHPLSFNDRIERLPYHTSAYDAYNSIFAGMSNGGGNNGSTPPVSSADPVLQNLFSHLSSETNSIVNNVPESERSKLLGYIDAVGALESQLVGQIPTPAGTAELNGIPNRNQSIGQDIDSYLDMVRVAFTNDTHRVAVVGFGDGNNEFPWTNSAGQQMTGHSGYTGDFHHDIAHYNMKPRDAQLAYIGWTAYYAQKITNFVQALQQTIDIDGNRLIDNTVIVLTGEVGNGNHDRRHKPHIVIGGGSRINRGRWYRTPRADASTIGSARPDGSYSNIVNATGWLGGEHSRFSHADLFVRIANLAGSNISSFGIDYLNEQPLAI